MLYAPIPSKEAGRGKRLGNVHTHTGEKHRREASEPAACVYL